ncbi:MAG: hypothetical protein ACLR8P_20355 [Clostridium fessum]
MDRILIVDDEFLIRYTLEEGLKDRGYDAYSAATVEEGLEFVRKYHRRFFSTISSKTVSGWMRLSISKMQMRNCRSS